MFGYNQGIAGRTQHTWGYRTSQLGNNRGTGQIKHIFVQPLAGTSSCAYVKARILIEIKKDKSNQINFYQYSETCLVWQSFDFRSHSSAGHGDLTWPFLFRNIVLQQMVQTKFRELPRFTQRFPTVPGCLLQTANHVLPLFQVNKTIIVFSSRFTLRIVKDNRLGCSHI